jgi:hypothetical protein
MYCCVAHRSQGGGVRIGNVPDVRGRFSNLERILSRRTNLGTEAEPQQIVAQRLLSCLQYLVLVKSSTEDLTRPTFCFVM